MDVHIERTSAQMCDTTSLALASGTVKGSKRDSARAIAGGVGSHISMKVTKGLPLQIKSMSGTRQFPVCTRGCIPKDRGYGVFRIAAAVFAEDGDQGARAGLCKCVKRMPQILMMHL
jgi:hypothetical protein